MVSHPFNTHRYASFLLRLWQEGESAPWRASLEDPRTGERKAFSETDALFKYLLGYMQNEEKDHSEEV